MCSHGKLLNHCYYYFPIYVQFKNRKFMCQNMGKIVFHIKKNSVRLAVITRTDENSTFGPSDVIYYLRILPVFKIHAEEHNSIFRYKCVKFFSERERGFSPERSEGENSHD